MDNITYAAIAAGFPLVPPYADATIGNAHLATIYWGMHPEIRCSDYIDQLS